MLSITTKNGDTSIKYDGNADELYADMMMINQAYIDFAVDKLYIPREKALALLAGGLSHMICGTD